MRAVGFLTVSSPRFWYLTHILGSTWLLEPSKQVAPLKILIEIRRAHHEALLSSLAKDSPLYSVMINAVIVRYSGQGAPLMMMVCEEEEAMALLDTAKQCYPEVAPEIEQSIRLKRTPVD